MSVCLASQLLPGSRWSVKVGGLWSLSFLLCGCVYTHACTRFPVSRLWDLKEENDIFQCVFWWQATETDFD